MTPSGSIRRIVAALIALTTTVIVARAEDVNDYPTAARMEYVFGCLKAILEYKVNNMTVQNVPPNKEKNKTKLCVNVALKSHIHRFRMNFCGPNNLPFLPQVS